LYLDSNVDQFAEGRVRRLDCIGELGAGAVTRSKSFLDLFDPTFAFLLPALGCFPLSCLPQ
jgi:hypothetical protein